MKRPISDLTMPVLNGGKIPLVELAKTAFPAWENETLEIKYSVNNEPYITFGNHWYSFMYRPDMQSFDCRTQFDGLGSSFSVVVPHQKQLFALLETWNFEI